MKDKVRFYLERDSSTEVFAVFPDDSDNVIRTLPDGTADLFMTCYAHIGQHSECTQGYLDKCKRIKRTDERVKDLINELKQIGYNI